METQLYPPSDDAAEPAPDALTGTLQGLDEGSATGVLDDGRTVKLRPAPGAPWPPTLEQK